MRNCKLVHGLVIGLVAATLIGAGTARSQPTPAPTPNPSSGAIQGVLQNTYYANAIHATAPLVTDGGQDSTVRIINDSGEDLCAVIYVVNQDQEMKECCGCPISQGGTRTLSVNNDLTSNPVNGVETTVGSISILSSLARACDGALPKVKPQLEAYSTHVQNDGSLTEEEFTPLGASIAALAALTTECSAIELIGSGRGVCTCGTGG